jgi:hypothetical protein
MRGCVLIVRKNTREVMRVTGIRSCRKAFFMLMVALLAFSLPVACKENPPEIKNPEILGAWQSAGQTVTLLKNGEIILGTNWGTKQAAGKYEFIDDDTIKVKFKSSPPQDYNVSLSGDNLIVTRADGTLIGDYKRVKNMSESGVRGGTASD